MKRTSWGADLLDLLLPPGCVACGTWMPGGRTAPLICAFCRGRLRHAPWPRCHRCHFPLAAGRRESPDCIECRGWPSALTAARCAYVLEPPASDLVHALKYEGWAELADLMGSSLAGLPNPVVPSKSLGLDPVGRDEGSVVVPMPTTTRRLRRRGYNQAQLLAARLARTRQIRLVRAIARIGEGRSQTVLGPAERRENVRGVFVPLRGEGPLVSGAQVLLVDDVLTTGATASEAAGTLAAMGAASVVLLAFARALPSGPRVHP